MLSKEQIKKIKDLYGKYTNVLVNQRNPEIFEVIVINTKYKGEVTTYLVINNDLHTVTGIEVRISLIKKMETIFKEGC